MATQQLTTIHLASLLAYWQETICMYIFHSLGIIVNIIQICIENFHIETFHVPVSWGEIIFLNVYFDQLCNTRMSNNFNQRVMWCCFL